jgi:hypothetical protein
MREEEKRENHEGSERVRVLRAVRGFAFQDRLAGLKAPCRSAVSGVVLIRAG